MTTTQNDQPELTAIAIMLEGHLEGVQVFSTQELARAAVERWEREEWQELTDDGDDVGEFEPPKWLDRYGHTAEDDTYSGYVYHEFAGVMPVDTA